MSRHLRSVGFPLQDKVPLLICGQAVACLWLAMLLPAPVAWGVHPCQVYQSKAGTQALTVIAHGSDAAGSPLVELVWRSSGYVAQGYPHGPSLLAEEAAAEYNDGVLTCQPAVGGIQWAGASGRPVPGRPLCIDMAFTGTQATRFCVDSMDGSDKTLEWSIAADRAILGLGQYLSEPVDSQVDWRGQVWEPGAYGNLMRGFAGGATANTQIPVVYAVAGGGAGAGNTVGVFVDHVYRQKWDFTGAGTYEMSTWGDALRIFLFAGRDLRQARRSYLHLTGRPPLPQRAQFGLWVSEFGYDNWGEMQAAVDSLRREGFPLDGMAMDLQWYGTSFNDPDTSTMGSLAWDRANFPDPAAHVARLQDGYGLTLALIEQPYVSDRVDNHGALAARGHLVKNCAGCGPTHITYSTWWGRGGMIDFTDPAANAFWHEHGRQALVDLGIHGHWTDLGEPEMYHAWAYYHGFPGLGLHQHGDVHNIYNLKWVEGIAEGYRRQGTDARPLILTRSGSAGIQRHGVAMWSGDIGANIHSLRAQMRAQGHMSLSGIDSYGSDVGGFYRSSSDGREDELYDLWFANAALTEIPVRAHVWNLDNKTSSLPTVMGHAAGNLAAIRRRYALIPYYYSLARRATTDGDAIVAPMIYEFPGEGESATSASQKMIGPWLMTALATAYGEAGRDIHLPRGAWFDTEEGARFDSPGGAGGWLRQYPMQRDGRLQLPLFARAGAVIPRQAVPMEMHNSFSRTLDGRTDATLAVDAYGGVASSSFRLYEDDGRTLGYRRGEGRTTELRLSDTAVVGSGGKLSFAVQPAEGDAPGLPDVRPMAVNLFHSGFSPSWVALDGGVVAACPSPEAPAAALTVDSCFAADPARGVTTVKVRGFQVSAGLQVELGLRPAVDSRAAVLFVCEAAEVSADEEIAVVGNLTELGAWRPEEGLAMDPGRSPRWSLWLRGLPADQAVEWKCVKRVRGKPGQVTWQSGADNILPPAAPSPGPFKFFRGTTAGRLP